MSTPAKTLGVHHIGLTVPDLAATQSFFCDVLGYSVVGEKPDYPAVFVSDGTVMITLWQVADPATATPFDRGSVIGLHHLALKLADTAALDALHQRLAKTGWRRDRIRPRSAGHQPRQTHDVHDPPAVSGSSSSHRSCNPDP